MNFDLSGHRYPDEEPFPVMVLRQPVVGVVYEYDQTAPMTKIPLMFTWLNTDPRAVVITLGEGHPAAMTFSTDRTLFDRALYSTDLSPVGGDSAAAQLWFSSTPERLGLHLIGMDRATGKKLSMLVTCDKTELKYFISESFNLVGPGDESEVFTDLDWSNFLHTCVMGDGRMED